MVSTILRLRTKQKEEFLDITDLVSEAVKRLDKTGKAKACLVFSTHTTTALIINENNDPNLLTDIKNTLTSLVPEKDYLHNVVDNNASAHIKSSLLGNSLILPLENSQLVLGTWQRILLLEFDGPRNREVFVQTLD